jgi:hypothetical protein
MKELGSLLSSLDGIKKDLGADEIKLSFPEIAVVGQQSVGKSSVLERLTLMPLFPRGGGTVTLMPIKLRLLHKDAGELAAFCKEICTQSALASYDPAQDAQCFYIRAAVGLTDSSQAPPEYTPWEGPLRVSVRPATM